MRDYKLSHLGDAVLLRELTRLVVENRASTAALLAHISEVDARRLYVPAGYPSMHAYCVEELRLSEDAAYRRIRAARAARRFPSLLELVAEGRLHLAAVSLIAGHLTPENAKELIEAAIHRRKSEIEAWLARRFPMAEPRTFVRPIHVRPQAEPVRVQVTATAVPTTELSLSNPPAAKVSFASPMRTSDNSAPAPSPKGDRQLVPGPVACTPPVVPPQPERYLVQVAIPKSTHDKLRHAQALLSHAIPSGSVAQVLDRALDVLIDQLEKRKFGAASTKSRGKQSGFNPARRSRPTSGARHIPACVRRAVWERDQGRCTFVSSDGRRCESRKFLEYDHVEPVALGGTASVAGLRLRCRAHNQFEAERAFGAGFMSLKREEARRARQARHQEDVGGASRRAPGLTAPT